MEQDWFEKLAIQELCSRYCHTIDSQDPQGWAECFMPDGTIELDGAIIEGHAALKEYAAVHARILRGRHMTVNHLYEIHGNDAVGRATTVVTLATPGGYKIMGTAAYNDHLVKHNGQWLIRRRIVTTDRLVDDPQKQVNLADPDIAPLVQKLISEAKKLGIEAV